MSDFQSLILRDIDSKLTLINNNYFYYLKDDADYSGTGSLGQNPYLGFRSGSASEVDNLLKPYTSFAQTGSGTATSGTQSFTTSYTVARVEGGYLVVTNAGGVGFDSSFNGLPVTFTGTITGIVTGTTYYIGEIVNSGSSQYTLIKVYSLDASKKPVNPSLTDGTLTGVTMSVIMSSITATIVGINTIQPNRIMIQAPTTALSDFANDIIYVNKFSPASNTQTALSVTNANNNAIVLSVLNNENGKGSKTSVALTAVLNALKKVSGQGGYANTDGDWATKCSAYAEIKAETDTSSSVKTLIEKATRAVIQSQITNEGSYTLSSLIPYYWNANTGNAANTPKLATLVNDETIRDVNCIGYYSGSVVNYVQALYGWHNLLIPANWDSFINGNKTVLKIPETSGSNAITMKDLILELDTRTYGVTVTGTLSGTTGTTIKGVMDSLISFKSILQVATKINIYTIRRLFYIYIQIAQYCMAMGIVTRVFIDIKATAASGTIPSVYQTVFNNVLTIPKLVIQTLKNIATNDSALEDLIAVTQRRVDEYSKSVNVITNLDTNIKKGKIVLSNNQEKIKGQDETLKTIKKFELASIIVFCIVLAASCGLLVFPLEYSQKLTYALVIVVVAIASSFTIGLLFNKANIKTFEKFAVTSSSITDDYSRFVTSQNNAFYGLVSEYLTATISNTNALQTYNIYGNVNFALQKERTYYNNTDKTLTNVNSRMNSIYKITFLDQMQRTALMNFLMSVTIISAATIMAYIAVQDYETLSKVVLAVGFILVLIGLIIYILEVTQRVRTDGNKIYWGDLSNSTKNDLGN